MLFIDQETHLTAPGRMAPPLVCMSWADNSQPSPTLFDRPNALALLRGHLQCGAITDTRGVWEICGHNIAFDLANACAADPSLVPLVFKAYREERIFDTMVREQLLRNASGRLEQSGFGLDDCAQRRLGRQQDQNAKSEWRKKYSELDGVPISNWPPAAMQYALDGTSTCRDLFFAQAKEDPFGALVDQHRQCRGQWFLHLTSVWGIVTDPVAVETLARSLMIEDAELRRVLNTYGLLWPEPLTGAARKAQIAEHRAQHGQDTKPPRQGDQGSRNTEAIRARIVAAYHGNPPMTDPTPNEIELARFERRMPRGNVKTDDLTCSESGDPVLTAVGRFGEVSAMINKNLPLLRLGQIHTNFSQMAANGRSTSKNPNMQNPDKKGGVRPCFVARPGCSMITADYGSLELCTLAQYCLDTFRFSVLANEINAGLSPLVAFGASMYGCSYEQGLALHKAKDERFRDFRQSAKVALYGFPGGLGVGALPGFALSKYDVRITRQKSEELRTHWLRHYREMPMFLEHMTRLSEQGRIVQTRSGRVRGAAGFTDTCNTFFSGPGADIAKSAGFDVAEKMYARPESPLYGWRPINFVHDSIMCEGPPSGAEAAVEELSATMIRAAKFWLPDVAITTSKSISERWEEKD